MFAHFQKTEFDLTHIKTVLERVGWQRSFNENDFDLLWSQGHSASPKLKLASIMRNLKPHQLVNHLPGSGFYTSKVMQRDFETLKCLSFQPRLTQLKLPGIPISFNLPEQRKELLKYASENPNIIWVGKLRGERKRNRK